MRDLRTMLRISLDRGRAEFEDIQRDRNMLVQTSHAKHAATQAITAAALDPDRVVYVNGRGATALVRELLVWVRGSTAPA